MDDVQVFIMLRAMRAYGGGFVATLAEAWARADATNQARLARAFPDLVQRYGPGSDFYDSTLQDYQAQQRAQAAAAESAIVAARRSGVAS